VNGPKHPDPLDELRRANPVPDVEDLPSASLARVRARVMEDAIAHTDTSRGLSRRGPIAAGLVATAAAMALIVALAGRATAPGLGPDPSVPLIRACVETYSPETLRNRTFAFDGTALSIARDHVTFEVGAAFRGVGLGRVTLTATGMTGTAITPGEATSLEIGQRYLVAGDDRFVWGCGFTQPYDPAVAETWRHALAS
jgi:hypothetical protein